MTTEGYMFSAILFLDAQGDLEMGRKSATVAILKACA